MKHARTPVRPLGRTLVGVAAALALSAATPRHITPTVVLEKQADVIRTTVPGATGFFLKTVDIGRTDYERIRTEGGFEPEDDAFKFFYGKDASGKVAGVVLFPQVNTQHGPLEVGLSMTPDGAIRKAVVTKATVETKPWVMAATKAGLMKGFEGMRPGDDASGVPAALAGDDLGKMPVYMAKITAEAVARGLVLYRVLYDR
jgi:hypothetical protein